MRNLVINLSNVPNVLLDSIQKELNEFEESLSLPSSDITNTLNIDYMQLPPIAREQLLAPIISAFFTCKL